MTPLQSFFLQAAVRGLTSRWLCYMAGAWLGLGVFTFVALPLKFPLEAQDEMVDSGVVVGLVVPLAVMSRILDEGPVHLVASAARNLTAVRLGWATAFLCVACIGSVVAWTIAPVPFSLFLSDTFFLGAATVLGVGVLGSRLGWLLPLVVTLVASGPGLIPWQSNLLYREDTSIVLLLLAGAVTVLGLIAYGQKGSLGLLSARAPWLPNAPIVDD